MDFKLDSKDKELVMAFYNISEIYHRKLLEKEIGSFDDLAYKLNIEREECLNLESGNSIKEENLKKIDKFLGITEQMKEEYIEEVLNSFDNLSKEDLLLENSDMYKRDILNSLTTLFKSYMSDKGDEDINYYVPTDYNYWNNESYFWFYLRVLSNLSYEDVLNNSKLDIKKKDLVNLEYVEGCVPKKFNRIDYFNFLKNNIKDKHGFLKDMDILETKYHFLISGIPVKRKEIKEYMPKDEVEWYEKAIINNKKIFKVKLKLFKQ